MKVAVIGARGQLGSDLVRVFSQADYEVHGLTHDHIEVTDANSVRRALEPLQPDVVINCAAFHRVDECEDQPEAAFQVNSVGAFNVARVCRALEALFVHISTDYVFDGDSPEPYSEGDVARPVNVYGASKLAGEHLVRQEAPAWIIVRVSSLFGEVGASGKGGNFVETILNRARAGQPLRVVADIRMSPTYTLDAARALEALIGKGARGVFHVTNRGACTWYEFASETLKLVGLDVPVEPIPAVMFPGRARRPFNSALRHENLRAAGIDGLRPWQDALRAYLTAKGHIPGC